MVAFRNWAGNQTGSPSEVRTPANTGDVADAVRDAAASGRRIKMVGTGHSFTGIALTDGIMLRPDRLRRIREVGPDRVTVEAGCPLSDFNAELERRGLALANMGDIMVQTVSGAVQTGTHGTGRDAGGLADQVLALELVLADGSVVTCSADRDPDLFDAARVGLGALGIVTAITFRVEPSFLLHADERPATLTALLHGLDTLTEGNEHFEFYWFPHTEGCQVKRNNRTPGPARPLGPLRDLFNGEFLQNTVFGAICATGAWIPATVKPFNRVSAAALGVNVYSDASYKVFTSSRRVRFLEQEYAIPREHLAEALHRIRETVDSSRWRIGFPVEVRVSPADDAWLSTAYGRRTAYIAAHTFHRTPNPEYFAALEEILTWYGGRPHWGKLHTRDAGYLRTVYPRFDDFRALRDRLDPGRLFTNDYLDRILGTAASGQ
ncbi:D-arabinono-1,4-lactone oxidase [Rhizohabitans arisaemae]|uniref:D-arabinono-1,4-lactone oxidase n=1 Tax=Rhizohabitans arisaemae TaxID=2720610 RepID=UPI0024B1A983|nr:D-arabinono-1,4-lactone oxidase [Rhizohabitans arisaemae]